MAKLKIAHKETNGTFHSQDIPGAAGGTGGPSQSITTTGVKTIDVSYNTTANAQVTHGYIIAQKGSRKFRVANSASAGTSITTVTLVNATGGLRTASQGSISGYTSANAAFNASRITNKFVYDFAGNRYRYVLTPTVAGAGFANVSAY
jgi:hypothetical protein